MRIVGAHRVRGRVTCVTSKRPQTRGEGLPALLAVALAVVMTWPLVLHLGTETQFVDTWGDPLHFTWQVAWIGHALLHNPLHILQSNLCFPLKNNLTFSDVLFGYAPAGLFASSGPHAALIVHNLLFIFTYGLAFLGAYLLARELGAGDLGGAAAGAAFAYAPWKLGQNGHLNLLSSGGIPLALALLLRGYRRGSGRMILGGWLVAAWQMTLGFNLGLQFAYLLLALGVLAAVHWVIYRMPVPSRAVIRANAAGIAVFVTVTVLVAVPYVRARQDLPVAKTPATTVAFYSPPPRAFVTAPSFSYVWGGATAERRATLRVGATIEQTLFPGVTVLLLALLGLASSAYSFGLRLGLMAGTLVCFALSLGLPSVDLPDRGFTPFRFLYDFAPGWNNVRTPGRINNLTSLGLALLAGAGVALIVRAVRRQFARKAVAGVAAGALAGAILVEGFGPIPHPRVPAVPPGEFSESTPQLDIPTNDFTDGLYAYWGIGRFPTMADGALSFDPQVILNVRAAAQAFPDATSVQFLRSIGVRSVILHRDLAFGTPWQDTADRPVTGLRITRRDEGNLVLYELGR
jgi:hypothetical protein